MTQEHPLQGGPSPSPPPPTPHTFQSARRPLTASQRVPLSPTTNPDVASYSADLSLIYSGKKNLPWPPNEITQGKRGLKGTGGKQMYSVSVFLFQ